MSKKKEEIAIRVESVSKTFRVPHEKNKSLKGTALNLFKKKRYEKFEALKNVSFEVKKGEFFGIIGKNGSGKSTLLKILAGIYIPDSGKIEINGKLSPFLELGVGFNPELTGRENLFLGGSILGLSRQEVADKFDRIVKFAELEEFIDMKLMNYSSGMQVRLAFSLAINAHAEILLMDEVLAVGDTNFQTKCVREFNKYKEEGKTVVLVTHDTGTVQKYCDRAILLRGGEIQKNGSAADVVNEYILQNMTDQERNNRGTNRDSGTKSSQNKRPVSITSVDFVDKDGKKSSTFNTGDYVGIRVKFNRIEKNNRINIGIGLHSSFGEVIFGYNTEIDEYIISEKDNSVMLRINNLFLLKGEYLVNVTMYGKILQDLYDYKPDASRMRIFSRGKDSQYGGLFSIKHDWMNNE